jgi:nitroreductase
MGPDVPPRALVERVLGAAAWAPNHRRTEPWRIVVVAGSARDDLGAVMEESLRERLAQASDLRAEDVALLAQKEHNKPLRAPIILALACVHTAGTKAIASDDYAAVAAAAQNMLLAAEALGLGAMWRTGKPAFDPRVKAFLGFPNDAEIVAFIYLGYPDLSEGKPRERNIDPYVRWMGWE